VTAHPLDVVVIITCALAMLAQVGCLDRRLRRRGDEHRRRQLDGVGGHGLPRRPSAWAGS
jgi:hypothetical protein